MDIVNLLKILNKGDNEIYDIENYNHIGAKVNDEFNMFVKNKEKSITKFSLITNKERLNLSVQIKTFGDVKMNPIQAKRNNLPKVIHNVVKYNNKTIIKDNQLNINKIELLIDNKTYVLLHEYVNKINVINNKHHVKIDLKKLPIYTFNKNDMINIKENTLNQFHLEIKQKVLRDILKTLPKPSIYHKEEQQNLLSDYGLTNNLEYKGIDNEKETKTKYKADTINFKLKGCSTLPNMKKINEKNEKNKKLTENEKYMQNYSIEILNCFDNNDSDEIKYLILNDKLSEIKSQLYKTKLKNELFRFAITYNNSELAIDDDDKSFKIEFKEKLFEI